MVHLDYILSHTKYLGLFNFSEFPVAGNQIDRRRLGLYIASEIVGNGYLHIPVFHASRYS